MNTVAFSDVAWQATIPHRVTPRHEEWFAGLLLRCDEANHWASGTIWTHLKHTSGPMRPPFLPYLSVPTHHQVAYVAEWLSLPVQDILSTTYIPELTRYYGLLDPLPGDLRPSLTFRICPACLEEDRFLKRTLALLYVSYCPWHEVTLISTCQCGAPLQLFNPQALPFTCYVCGRDWANLPKIAPTPERIAVTRQILSCYQSFYFGGNPALVERAFRAVVYAWQEEIIQDRKLPYQRRSDQKTSYPRLASNHVASLSTLVLNLVKYHIYYDPNVAFWGKEDWGIGKVRI
jgi:hypothetical protein